MTGVGLFVTLAFCRLAFCHSGLCLRPWKTECRQWRGSLWSHNCFSKNNWLLNLRTLSTWSTKLKLLWKTIPINLADCTCSITSNETGKDHLLGRGPWKNNSLVLLFITAFLTEVYSAFHPSGVGKLVPAIAGKAKAGMAHSDCQLTCGCGVKTVKSLENTCHTWALLRWWFTTKRRYIKCMHLYLMHLYCPDLVTKGWYHRQ